MKKQLRWLCLSVFVAATALTSETVNAQQAVQSPGPLAKFPTGDLTMPSITPEQAAAMLSTRQIPPSDAPALQLNANAILTPVPTVEAQLGHDLPLDATAQNGFPRADFAIAKSDPALDREKKSKAILGPSIALDAQKPPTAFIKEQPPVLVSP